MAILMMVLKETVLRILGKLAAGVVAERFVTRILIKCLERLEKQSTNTIGRTAIKEILLILKYNKLKCAEEKLLRDIL